MARINARAAGVCLLALALCGQLASACTSILFDGAALGSPYNNRVSVRTMDFGAEFGEAWSVTTVAGGKTLARFPIRPGAQATYQGKHSFTCITVAQDKFPKIYKNYTQSDSLTARYPGFCTDGLNAAGLSAAMQWHSFNKGLPEVTDSTPDSNSIAFADFIAWVLASFGSIAELKQGLRVTAMQPLIRGSTQADIPLQLVTNAQLDYLSTVLSGRPKFAVHWLFHDRAGQTAVLEFNAPGVGTLYDVTPVGVVTNDPDMPTQLAQYYKYRDAQVAKWGGVRPGLSRWPGGAMDDVPLSYGKSTSRFVRAAMVKELWGPMPWPTLKVSNWSPAFTGNSVQAAAMLVDSMMDKEAMVGVAPADTGYENPLETTHWRAMRVHDTGVYAIQTMASRQWRAIDVARAGKMIPRGKVFVTVALDRVVPPTNWASDETATAVGRKW